MKQESNLPKDRKKSHIKQINTKGRKENEELNVEVNKESETYHNS